MLKHIEYELIFFIKMISHHYKSCYRKASRSLKS